MSYIESSTTDELNDIQVPDKTYLMAAYTYDNAGTTEIEYITYVKGSGLIPEFEDVIEFTAATGEFFPRLYARLDGINLTHLPTTDPRYKSSKKMAKRLGIEWKGWVEQLHEAIQDVGDVKQLFMTLAAPVNTSDAVTCEYLYRYFSKLYDEQPTAPVGYVPPLGTAFNQKKGLSLRIADEAYAHHVEFNSIGFDTVTGNIGVVGTYSSTYVPETRVRVHKGLLYRYVTSAVAYHSIKWQDTETTYKEVRVYSLSSAHIFSGGGTSAGGSSENLIIPLDRSVLPKMRTAEIEILFAKCLHLFINIFKIIKEKWYQRGIFKVVMAVVAIVIAVVTVGAGAPLSAYILAAAYAVGVGFAISMVIQLAAKVLVKLGVGGDLLAIFVVVVAVVAIAMGGDGAQILDITAKTVLRAVNVAFQLSSQMSALELQETAKAMDAFQAQAKSKWQLIEEAEKLLEGGGVPLSLDVLMADLRSKVLIRLGESPAAFLSRSIGISNPGVLGYEMLSGYVDNALTLPDTYTMLNQMNRG